jgi:hypothetical protein
MHLREHLAGHPNGNDEAATAGALLNAAIIGPHC